MRSEGFELTIEPMVILLVPVLQLELLLCHYLLPLSHDHRCFVEVLQLLDGGIGTSLNCGI
jgi:hypothetical protein